MSSKTIGKIKSEPNQNGQHTLKCPQCLSTFLSKITTDDVTGAINNTMCLACGYTEEPKLFVAAAHQAEVNQLAMSHVTKELKKTLRRFDKKK